MELHRQQTRRTPPYRTPVRVSPFTLSDRGAALALLAFPMGLAFLAFIISVGTTAMGEMAKGSVRFYTAAFAYTFLMSSLMGLPAYIASYGWFWWRTKAHDADLCKNLWLMPLIAAVFVWFPALLFPQSKGIGRIQVYLLLAAGTVVIGYAWVAIVRLIFRFWRKV